MITASFQYESSLQYRIKALERELESFKSGEKYVKMKEAHRKETKALRKEIKKLEKELARLRREMADAREKWFEVFDDVIREEDGNARNAQAQIEKLRQQCFETGAHNFIG